MVLLSLMGIGLFLSLRLMAVCANFNNLLFNGTTSSHSHSWTGDACHGQRQ